ncbi:MAG: hypothetical protein H7Y04_12570, partial [Verrucomicrobia bacterium]|nr:hypothetical protein [Cytophagales bacterium]
SSGRGFDLGVGIVYKPSQKVSLRGGFRLWQWPFSFTINATRDGDAVKVIEVGKIRYSGLYVEADRTWKYFLISGGFNISFYNDHICDLTVRNSSGSVIEQKNNLSTSVVTSEFNQQVNLILGAGPLIPVGKNLQIKGMAYFVVPFSPVYDGISVPTIQINPGGGTQSGGNAKVNIDFFPVFKYGIGLEYLIKVSHKDL